METEEVIERAQRYIERADKLYSNFKAMLEDDDIEKAGEMLWGIFACYVNAYITLRTGKPAKTHKEIITMGKEIAKGLRDNRLHNAVEKAEKLHANYYHGFLNVRDLEDSYYEIKYATERIYGLIKQFTGF